MSFKKDAEIKLYVNKKDSQIKTAEKEESVRYTVDDLVKDSEKEKEEAHVSN